MSKTQKFKVGDTIRITGVGSSWNNYKPAQSALDLVGQTRTVSSITSDGLYVNLLDAKWMWHINDVELAASQFIEKIIAGSKLTFANSGALRELDAVFIGYAVAFGDGDAKLLAVIDEHGTTISVGEHVRIKGGEQLEIKVPDREKIVMHSVAFRRSCQPHDWNSVIMSDVELNTRKTEWTAYKILETWYE